MYVVCDWQAMLRVTFAPLWPRNQQQNKTLITMETSKAKNKRTKIHESLGDLCSGQASDCGTAQSSEEAAQSCKKQVATTARQADAIAKSGKRKTERLP